MPNTTITPQLDLLRWLSLAGGAVISSQSEQIGNGTTETFHYRGTSAQPWVMVFSLQFVAVIGGQVAFDLQAGADDISGWPESGAVIPIQLFGNEIALTVQNGSAQDCLVNVVKCSFSDEARNALTSILRNTPTGAN